MTFKIVDVIIVAFGCVNWKYLSFFTIGVSVVLSDRSLHREAQKKKIHQKLPPVGIETRTSGSSFQCLTNWARQESVGQKISEVSFVCFMHHFTCWTLFISRINKIQPDCYLIALGSGKALQFMRQLSGDGTISEQRIFSGSLRYGTPHMLYLCESSQENPAPQVYPSL